MNMKKKLLDYFATEKLEILDKGTPAGTPTNPYYQGVTFPYICEYVLENEYSKEEVAIALIALCKEEIIRAAPCNNVQNLVFFKRNNWGWIYFSIINNEIHPTYSFHIYNENMKDTIEFINETCKEKINETITEINQ